MEPNRRPFPRLPLGALTLIVGGAIALLSACTPGSGLPTQGPSTAGTTASSPEPAPSTATASTGGNVAPVINF